VAALGAVMLACRSVGSAGAVTTPFTGRLLARVTIDAAGHGGPCF
jgi:hypothetical protein